MSNIKKLDWYWRSGASDPATNASGEQVIAFIGDSNIVGQGLTVGPTPTAGTVKQLSSGAIVNVTNTDILEGLTTGQAANIGSMMPKFGIDYNARTGKIPVIVSCGRGGSEFASAVDDNDFSPTGENRALTEARIASALTLNGTTKLAEIIVNLGINDFSSANSFATISTAIDSFFTWLTTTYPGVRITMLQIGRTAASINSTKQSQIRDKLRSVSESNANIHLLHAPVAFNDYGYMKADLLHYNQDGNNFLGEIIDDYLEAVDAGYDKIAAGIFCSFKDAVNSTKKDAINAFISKYKNTNLALCSTFQVYKSDTAANAFLDWVGNLASRQFGTTFVANTEIRSAGATNSFIDTMWMIDEQIGIGRTLSDEDLVIGCRGGTKTTADGTTASFLGAVGSTDGTSINLWQVSGTAIWLQIAEDSTVKTVWSTPPDVTIIAETLYELIRTGSAAHALNKNGTQLFTGTTAYEGTLNRTIKLGGRSTAADTVSSAFAGGYKVFYVAQADGFDRTDWNDDLDTLLDAL